MNLEKCTIDDIRNENTQKYFADLMKSEGFLKVAKFWCLFCIAILAITLSYVLISMHPIDKYTLEFIICEFVSLTLINIALLVALGYFFQAHTTIYRIKISDSNYISAVKNWLISNNFHKQELDQKVYILKPDSRFFAFSTILFTVEDGYAIILAPSLRLKNFAKVFE